MTARPTVRDPGARRIVYVAMSTLTAVVLLFGYRTSSPETTTSAIAASTSAAGGASTPAAANKSFTGAAVSTRWGPVQVQITVAGGRVTAATAVQVPDGNRRDVAINARAVPVLDAEVLAAQNEDIDTVSGATVTSDGYVASLQSALDAAGL